MKKSDIINFVACANVPAGAQLKQHEVEEIQFAIITPENSGGLDIMFAQFLTGQLEADTVGLPDEPSAELFECLHKSALKFYTGMIADMVIEAVAEETVEDYRRLIGRLQGSARHLQINYRVPKDGLLD